MQNVLVGLIMGSQSDWETLKHCSETMNELAISHSATIVSAHRTPDRMFTFAEQAISSGLEVIIAGAGGAAHLPGMVASKTSLPVIGVPIQSLVLNGVDSLLSIVQMPAGIPVATMAIGKAGAINAALFAAAILANKYPTIREAVCQFRKRQTEAILQANDPRQAIP